MDLTVFCLLLLSLVSMAHQSKIVCYYGSWASTRDGNGKCTIDDLDPSLCTHLIYAFAIANEDGTLEANEGDHYTAFNKLKQKNPNLKTLISIGGAKAKSAKFSKVANDASLRAKFAQNAADLAKKYGFDGVDVDWEFPAREDSPNPSTDKQAYTLLLKEMRAVFDQQQLLLTAAVAATEWAASQSYEIPAISEYLDFINVMAYDFYGSWETKTGHHAALKAYPSDSAANHMVVIDYWIKQGAPREKIVMGMPTYGKTFKLANPQQNGVGAPSTGNGLQGPYTKEAGFLGYNELCEKRLTEQWPEMWDNDAVAPYTSKGNDWISYENGKSLNEKAKVIASMGLGGAMIWSMETDDFRNVCGDGAYPLLRQIKAGLGDTSTPDTMPPQNQAPGPKPIASEPQPIASGPNPIASGPIPNTNGPIPTTKPTSAASSQGTNTSPGSFSCTEVGSFRDPIKCDVYYQCYMSGEKLITNKVTCGAGTAYNPNNGICDHVSSVQC